MPNDDRIIVGIDVGTHKVCTIVAEVDPGSGSRLNVLGAGAVASEGVSKGMISDIVKASGAIAHSLEAAERQSGCRILSAYVSISGNHVASLNSRGLVAVSHPDRIIGSEDVERAIEAARAMAIPAGRDVLHVIPRTYTVDGQEGIRNPVGFSGFRLDVETHVVTGATNIRENLVRCVQKADVEVDDLVLSPLASGEAVLTEQEKTMGVVHVDIGHGTTDIAIYVEGSVWHTRVIPVGGWQLTNDLVIVFNIPYEEAEALKLQYGRAVVPGSIPHRRTTAQPVNGKSHPAGGQAAFAAAGRAGADAYNLVATQVDTDDALPGVEQESDDELLEAQTFEGSVRQIGRSELNEVMAARLEQLLGLVADEVRRSGYEGLLPAGVVITGGVAQMPGLEQVAQHKLRMPVRTGRPKKIGGLVEAFDSPAYATSVGLILWGMKQGSTPQPGLSRAELRRSTAQDQQPAFWAKWLNRFLPQG
ncbi:MAG TPA: cell division protein FtsA [Chloroflexia bacterium]|nr:cell division protein FtsA [Chloroflexia bacterium]